MFYLKRLGWILVAIAACAGVEVLVTSGANHDYIYRMFVLAGLYVTLSVSLNLINGITGQFSVGHAAFYQVGAYAAGFLAVQHFNGFASNSLVKQLSHIGVNATWTVQALWLVLMIIVGAAVAAVAGFVVGLPSLRLKGDYLAIVTLGFGEIIRIVCQNQPALGGAYGMKVEPRISAMTMVWILAVLCIAVCRNLLKSAHGLPFLAVREDEVASAAMGVDVTKVKVTAFVVGAAFAGAAGALLGHFEGFVSPQMFKMEVSFLILTMVVLGGTGSITGSTFGALLLFGIPEWLRQIEDKNHNPILVSAGTMLSFTLFLLVAVAIVRHLILNDHSERKIKAAKIVGVFAGALVAQWVFGIVLNLVPALHNKAWPYADLRWAILAMTLIVLMLLRPQGVFAQHEFSPAKFFKRKTEGAAA
ncbi:MAG: branched-chain amino acid ABC transporter permease [Fimbriimonadaceae bacterium]|nr:branched-chain amino acid ABC transporter permease [Fimbriimonadaceae bacterium]